MSKKLVYWTLLVSNILIIASGIFFIIYSLINNVYIKVLNTNVHGAIFGLLVFYFGIRYIKKTIKFKKELFKSENQFSWSNFKRYKKEEM